MSDFTVTIDMLRGQMAEALLYSPEEAAWVFAEFAERAGPSILAELARYEHCSEHCAEEVAAFWRGFAEMIHPSERAEND